MYLKENGEQCAAVLHAVLREKRAQNGYAQKGAKDLGWMASAAVIGALPNGGVRLMTDILCQAILRRPGFQELSKRRRYV